MSTSWMLLSTFGGTTYASCSCFLNDIHKRWGTCWFVHPSQSLLTQWSSHRLHVATMVQVLLPVQSQSYCFWFLWIIWRSQSLQTDKLRVNTLSCDITFIQAASASLIVLITASIKFWAFFTSITSACRVASHDIACYIGPLLLTEISLGVAAFTDEMIVSWVASVGISSTLCSILYFIL